jgi:hypothetical protein
MHAIRGALQDVLLLFSRHATSLWLSAIWIARLRDVAGGTLF